MFKPFQILCFLWCPQFLTGLQSESFLFGWKGLGTSDHRAGGVDGECVRPKSPDRRASGSTGSCNQGYFMPVLPPFVWKRSRPFHQLLYGGTSALPLSLKFLFFFLNLMFIFERERQSASKRGAEREGDTESEAGSRLRAVSTEPDVELEPTDREIMT